jgi:hypothetical protein
MPFTLHVEHHLLDAGEEKRGYLGFGRQDLLKKDEAATLKSQFLGKFQSHQRFYHQSNLAKKVPIFTFHKAR